MSAQILITTPPPSKATERERTASISSVTEYRNNATDIVPLRVNVADPDYEDQIIQVAQALSPNLKKSSNNLSVSRLGGGLSNELFIVHSDNDRKSVLVRIHPSNTNANTSNLPSIVDRNVENTISAWLSSQNVGPTYYGRFQNGRVEEFFHNHSPLSWKDMSQLGPSHIAPIMAKFHELQVPSSVLECPSTTNGDIFTRVREWLELADTLCKSGTNEKASKLLTTFQQDWHWLEDTLLKKKRDNLTPQQQLAADFFGEIVFTHMDMQSLNLLRDDNKNSDQETTKIQVIDFEYAGFNPRAVDMANTFCEHCDMNNIQADYAKEYPSEQAQNAFVQSYIRNLSLSSGPVSSPTNLEDAAFLEAARTEIGRYTLVSHMSWAIWSIVQSHMSDIHFDYLKYAEHRHEGFEFMKAKLF